MPFWTVEDAGPYKERLNFLMRTSLFVCAFSLFVLGLGKRLFDGLDAKTEINHVEEPYTAENGAGNEKILLEHHEKSGGHENGHGCHDFDLGFFRHALALDVGFQIVFVKLGSDKPSV